MPDGKMERLPIEIIDMVVLFDVKALYLLSSTCLYYRRRYVWDENFIERYLPVHANAIADRRDRAWKDHKRRSTPVKHRTHRYTSPGTTVKNTARHRGLVDEGYKFSPSVELYGSFSIQTGSIEGLVFVKWVDLITRGKQIHSTFYIMTDSGLMTLPKQVALPQHWRSLSSQFAPEDFLKLKELPTGHKGPYELPGYYDRDNNRTVMFCKLELCESLPMTPYSKRNYDSLVRAVEEAKVYLALSGRIPTMSQVTTT